MIVRQTSLSKNIVGFCRFLRERKFSVSVQEEITALKALTFINYERKEDFSLALKSVLCRSHSELREFDNLFDLYWKEMDKAADSKIKMRRDNVNVGKSKPDSFRSLKSWLNKGQNNEVEQTATYSHLETLSQKNFSFVSADEVEELMRIIKSLSRRLAARIGRRYEKSNKINLPDLRRTLRLNMRRGGELMEIQFRKPKRTRTNLVIFCDVSKSMDLYSAFLLQFMYAFQQVYKNVHAFTFGTSLQCITSFFKQNDFSTALYSLNLHSGTWSGGTRTGECLNAFINEYASRTLSKRTIVIILSDGWDTGEIPLLQKSMEVIWSRSKKIIWLNPLAGYASYRPETAGMQAALPFVDVFASIHNADSLRSLNKWL